MPNLSLTTYTKVQIDEYLRSQGIMPAIMTAADIERELKNPNSPISKLLFTQVYFVAMMQQVIMLLAEQFAAKKLQEAKQAFAEQIHQADEQLPKAEKTTLLQKAEVYAAGAELRKIEARLYQIDHQLVKDKAELVKMAKEQAGSLNTTLAKHEKALLEALPNLLTEEQKDELELSEQKRESKQTKAASLAVASALTRDADFAELDELYLIMRNPLIRELRFVMLVRSYEKNLDKDFIDGFQQEISQLVKRQRAEAEKVKNNIANLVRERQSLFSRLENRIDISLNIHNITNAALTEGLKTLNGGSNSPAA